MAKQVKKLTKFQAWRLEVARIMVERNVAPTVRAAQKAIVACDRGNMAIVPCVRELFDMGERPLAFVQYAFEGADGTDDGSQQVMPCPRGAL
jgi:hypothetical protein